MVDDRSAGGLRRSPLVPLTDEEISFIKSEIRAIDAGVAISHNSFIRRVLYGGNYT